MHEEREEERPRRRWRPLRQWESAVERTIREAQERGEFDNLPGAGRPLSGEGWEGEWGMAHHLLKQAGETLPWIALGQEIEARQAQLDTRLAEAVRALDARRGQPAFLDARERLRQEYLRAAAELDALLLRYSLTVPVARLEKGRLPPSVAAARFDAACPS